MPKPLIRPRKLPRQTRSAATVEVMLEAAARVLSESSLAGFNTNRVAEVAGVSVGSLYQYYPNKAALVAALIERTQTSLAEGIEQAVLQAQGQPLVKVLTAMTDIAIDHQFGNATLAAALDHEEQRLPLSDVLQRAQMRIVQAVRSALHKHADLHGAPVTLAEAGDCLVLAKALIEAEAAEAKPNVALLRGRVLRALLGYLRKAPLG